MKKSIPNKILIDLRTKLGLSRKQLCNLINTSSRTYQAWELGINNPPHVLYTHLELLLSIQNYIVPKGDK